MTDPSRTISKFVALVSLLARAGELTEDHGSRPQQIDGWLIKQGDMPTGIELSLSPADEPDASPPSRRVFQLAPLKTRPESLPDAIPFIPGFRLRLKTDKETRLAVWLQFSGGADYGRDLIERLTAEEVEQLRTIAKIHDPEKLDQTEKREVLDTYVRLIHEATDPVEANALKSAWMQVFRDSVVAGWDSIAEIHGGLQIQYVVLRKKTSSRQIILCEFGPLRLVGIEDTLATAN